MSRVVRIREVLFLAKVSARCEIKPIIMTRFIVIGFFNSAEDKPLK